MKKLISLVIIYFFLSQAYSQRTQPNNYFIQTIRQMIANGDSTTLAYVKQYYLLISQYQQGQNGQAVTWTYTEKDSIALAKIHADSIYFAQQLLNKQNVYNYTPYDAANPANYISGITSNMIFNALGFTPYDGNSNPNHFLLSYTETDPTVASYIKAITQININNWNTSYSWGNHATQGYLKFYNENDSIALKRILLDSNYFANQLVNIYNNLNSNPNHYLTSFTETDSIALKYLLQNYTPSSYLTILLNGKQDRLPYTQIPIFIEKDSLALAKIVRDSITNKALLDTKLSFYTEKDSIALAKAKYDSIVQSNALFSGLATKQDKLPATPLYSFTEKDSLGLAKSKLDSIALAAQNNITRNLISTNNNQLTNGMNYGLASDILLRLKLSDTAAMLVAYARYSQVVKYTDTLAMLNPYLKINVANGLFLTQTTANTLYQVIGNYLLHSDSTVLLAKYALKNNPESSPTRTIGTVFQISTTDDYLVFYTVQISVSVTLVLQPLITVYLEISPDNTTWTTKSSFTNPTIALVVLTQISSNQLTCKVPKGYYVRLRASGTGSSILYTQEAKQ